MNNLRIKKVSTFIKEVRDCNDIDKEKKLVEKKLNKIRNKFMNNKNNSENKKQIWQLAYAQSIGYIIDFGYNQILILINSSKFSEKYTGYVTTPFMIPEHELDSFDKMTNTLKNDLYSKNQQV